MKLSSKEVKELDNCILNSVEMYFGTLEARKSANMLK